MNTTALENLFADIRIQEGLNACMNCGICTAICPAAEYYEYDPRSIVTTVLSRNAERIGDLLRSEQIWYCGQCMSCKTRCPRNNCPGQIISALRLASQETGAFTASKKGRQQYLIRQVIGNNILNHGYCLHPTSILPSDHPEQGTVWKWVHENMQDVYDVMGANFGKDGPGALRKIPEAALDELRAIFEHTGNNELFDSIDSHSKKKADELGLADMDAYMEFILNE